MGFRPNKRERMNVKKREKYRIPDCTQRFDLQFNFTLFSRQFKAILIGLFTKNWHPWGIRRSGLLKRWVEMQKNLKNRKTAEVLKGFKERADEFQTRYHSVPICTIQYK